METITYADTRICEEHRPPVSMRAAGCTYANVVFLHWLAAPGFYLVLAPSDPANRHGRFRTRYVGPVSNPVAAEMLKVSALAFGIADRAFEGKA
jgi:hypothetical protein